MTATVRCVPFTEHRPDIYQAFEFLPGASQTRRSLGLAPEPKLSYDAFIVAVRRRDLDNVLGRLSTKASAQFRSMREQLDFGPLFDLWCDSYPAAYEIRWQTVNGTTAELGVRFLEEGRQIDATVRLVLESDGWHVDAEAYG